MEPEKKKAGRPPRRKPNEKLGNSIKIEDEAARILEVQAKKLKVAKGKFASAAIAYCIESGINPLVEQTTTLGGIGIKIEAGVASVRVHNADIGNRLYALTRGFEKTIYQFMQQQQHATYSYIEAVESNLLRHLVSLETQLLTPMLEQVLRAKFETLAARFIEERSFLKLSGRPESDWEAMHERVNADRDKLLIADLREHLGKYQVPTHRPNAKPSITPVPVKPAPAPTKPPIPAGPEV